jgi:hypothetical protein
MNKLHIPAKGQVITLFSHLKVEINWLKLIDLYALDPKD